MAKLDIRLKQRIEQHNIRRTQQELFMHTDLYKIKSWHTREGKILHQFAASLAVRKWLQTEHSQFKIKNPQWWEVYGYINMTDEMATLTMLRWS